MATVILPSSLQSRAGGSCHFAIEAATAGEALRRLEEQLPAIAGWVLDEQRRLREHIKIFVNAEQAELGTPLSNGDELHVVRAISGGSGARKKAARRKPAKKASAKKGPARRASRKAPAKKAASRKAARKAPSKKVAAGKQVRKATSEKTAAKKAPRKKADPGELLVGTHKGLIVMRGERGGPMDIAARRFAGQPVEFAIRDARSRRYFASVTHGQHGPHLFYADDPTGEWQQAQGPVFPESADAALKRIWIVQPGVEDGVLWAGVAPAALFRSEDDGVTWTLNEGLWNQPSRPQWEGGMGGLCLHSICPWPGAPEKLAVAISAVGVWVTEDGGATWRSGNKGLVPRYLPEEARENTLAHCVHNMHRAPGQPETLYMQFHGGVYRSDDAGESWNDVAADTGLPADFGFPLALDAADPDSAFVIPMVSDQDRVTVNGKVRVYETRDRGASWRALSKGLPQEDAYLTVLRQAFGADGRDPLGLYFGAESGDLYGSADGGKGWVTLATHLPPILSVRASH